MLCLVAGMVQAAGRAGSRGLVVVDAATVICLRHRGGSSAGRGDRAPELLHRSRFQERSSSGGEGLLRPPSSSLDKIFAGLEALDFTSGWEVLLGQAECVNWLRSTGTTRESGLKVMRYPGEFRLAGGAVDAGESLHEAAQRELEEEFLRPAGLKLPVEAKLRPFGVKQTLPVASKSNLMWNFVALEEENPWLESLDVPGVNAELSRRRARFENSLRSGEYWQLSLAEREHAAPEVRELRWLSLCEAVWLSLSTMAGGGTGHFANDFQRDEFARLGISKRDPMFITGCALVEMEAFPSPRTLLEHCRALEAQGGMQKEQAEIQWLLPGMAEDEVDARIAADMEPGVMVKDWRQVRRLRAAREGGRRAAL